LTSYRITDISAA